MSSHPHIEAAQKALRSFLSTLLGQEAPLHLNDPELTAQEAALPDTVEALCVVHADDAEGFAAVLDASWLPLLSESMLGEAMTADDPDAADLVGELAGQAYSTLRTQFSTMGVQMPTPSFEVVPPGVPLPASSLPDTLHRIDFDLHLGGKALRGFVLLPPLDTAGAPDAAGSSQSSAAGSPPVFGVNGPVGVAPMNLPDLGREALGGDGGAASNLTLLADVEMEVRVELGRRLLPLSDLIRLTVGSVIELEKLVGEPLEIYANGRLIAEGEAVVIEEQFGIRITRLSANRKPDVSFRSP